ncbi:MAG: 2-C-methyl-D-erythritol 4-phosphate cytidylyltransferase [Clostridiales bacterium]|nr:2-C-methyl-D-erythritol 4-phosphate cytidylyltransferase [Clostridiales bacterium]
MRKSCTAVIVAAGSARRMQGIDKIMTQIGGKPMLLRTVEALSESEKIDSIVIVTRADLVQTVQTLCAGDPKLQAVVSGGESRAESVLCGLSVVKTPLAAIHDGARPLVTRQIIDAAIETAENCGAAAPAIAVHDTIKVARGGIVCATPDRATLFAVQTPQVFVTEKIKAALCAALEQGAPLTDDCSAAEFAGMEVRLTQGSEENLKITVPTDLILAEAIVKGREMP